MLEKIKNIFRNAGGKSNKFSSTKGIFEIRQKLMKEFFSRREHQWLGQDRQIKRALVWMWEVLPDEALLRLSKSSPLCFVFSSGRLSGTYHQNQQNHVVLIFSDLLKLLRSADPGQGVATLIHEIGHVLENHSGKKGDPLQAQVEADRWVVASGLEQELEAILMDLPESIEKRLRLSHLTSLVVQKRMGATSPSGQVLK